MAMARRERIVFFIIGPFQNYSEIDLVKCYSLSSEHETTAQNLTTADKTIASLTAATGATTLRRGWIYDLMVGADGTPADNQITWSVSRQTTVGTGDDTTPNPLDFGDAAHLLVATVNNTIEPTVTVKTFMIQLSVNQRASYRWVAAPGGELIVPATDVTGIGLRAQSLAYTSTVTATVHYWE